MDINYINPENMVKPRGYSHAISVSGNRRTIYIGGQNALNENGILIGKNNLSQQTEQVLANIEKLLEKAGAKIENVVKMNIHILHGQNPQDGFQVFQKKWGKSTCFPTVTVLFVSGFVHTDWLLEIDAIAEIAE